MIKDRPRRNRKSQAIRSMVAETILSPSSLVYPLFVQEYLCNKEPIPFLPGTFRHPLESLLVEVEKALSLGIQSVILFPVVPKEKRDPFGKEALNVNSKLCQSIREIKARFPEVCLITDIALDPYTSHGHDGVLDAQGDVDNDNTIEILSHLSLLHAKMGADIVAPSDMMDGRVAAIRETLDRSGYSSVSIMVYSAKYASCFYSPFRGALGTSHVSGKQSYQMDPANQIEALREAKLDEQEGADILMIKPALHYLDVIAKVKERSHLPISAYHVSGEYALLHAGAREGWLDFERALWETTLCIKRAGANLIITYGALELAKRIKDVSRAQQYQIVGAQ